MNAALAAVAPSNVSARYSNPTLSGRVLPTGRFTVGFVPSRDYAEDHIYLTGDDRADCKEYLAQGDPLGALKIDAVARAAPSLDNGPYFQQTLARAPKGREGITRNGRDGVQCGGMMLETYHDRSQLSFTTLTVPPLPEGSNGKLNKNWGSTCNRFLTALNRALKPHGYEGRYVYVSEIQEGRWKDTGDVYLHLHLVFVNRRRGSKAWLLSIPKLRAMWLAAMAPDAPEVMDCPWVQVKAVEVKKSVRNYLAKYLSKGAAITREVIDAGKADHLPGHWWGSSHKVKERVRQHTAELPPEACQLLWTMALEGPGEEIKWAYPSMVQISDNEVRHVGWSGDLSEDFAKELLSLFAELPPNW